MLKMNFEYNIFSIIKDKGFLISTPTLVIFHIEIKCKL